jgi:hypothetical protein
MIVGPLKNNIQASILMLLLVAFSAWIFTFYFVNPSPLDSNNDEHILFTLIFDSGHSFIFNQICTLLIILMGAFFINFIAIEQDIVAKTNYLPAFFYIIIAFSANTKTVIQPSLTANLFILPAMYFLINSYRKDNVITDVFKAGLFMGISSFFCIHYILAFPLTVISLIILRSFNWREWAVLFIGIVTPLYVYLCVCYLTSPNAFLIFDKMAMALNSIQQPLLSEYYIGFILMIAAIFVFAMFRYLAKGFGGKIKTQKTKYILIWMLLLSFVTVFFEQNSDMILLPCIIPLSILLGDYIAELKPLKFANTFIVLLMGGFLVIYLHLLNVI